MTTPRHLRLDHVAGATILSMLIAVGLLGIAVVTASMGFANLMAARKSSAASVAVRDSQDAMVQRLAQAYKAFISTGCAPIGVPLITTLTTGSTSKLTRTSNIVVPNGAGGSAASDVSRCSSAAPPGSPSASSFYSCFQLSLANGIAARADNAAFASSKATFVETYVAIKDFRSDAPVACSAVVLTDPSATPPVAQGFGLEMYYSIHWVVDSTQGLLYKTRVGSINAGL